MLIDIELLRLSLRRRQRMRLGKLVFHVAACAVTLMSLVATTRADVVFTGFSGPVLGQVYRQAGNLLSVTDATQASTPAGTYEGSFTSTDINFVVPQPNSNPFAMYLASCACAATPDATLTGSGVLAQPMSDAATYSTEIKFSGTANFVAGTTYTVTHDDGVKLFINGVLVVNSGAPTTPINSTFTASGTQTFALFYMATNGNPEDTIISASAVPEPTSLLLLATTLLGVGGLLRKKFHQV
jgi:hypothetical protein